MLNTKANTSDVKPVKQVKSSATHVDIWSVDISGITSWFKNYKSTSIVKLLDQRKYGTHVDIWSVDISGITSWLKDYRSTSKLALQTVKTLSLNVIKFIFIILGKLTYSHCEE